MIEAENFDAETDHDEFGCRVTKLLGRSVIRTEAGRIQSLLNVFREVHYLLDRLFVRVVIVPDHFIDFEVDCVPDHLLSAIG